ncbi:MAG: GTPase Era [Cyanobacteriota bacterium]|nr:GTPase Era [Cyanobacteriota bacterium]
MTELLDFSSLGSEDEGISEPITGTLIPVAPPGFRSGFMALIGRPNVGKSTLLNALVGQKVAITSPVAQTTRNRLQGILTLAEAQIILVDTPGIHKPHHRLGEILVENAQATFYAVDAIVFVVDGSVAAGRGDAYIAERIPAQVPTLICCNKSDLLGGEVSMLADLPYRYQDSYHELLPQADLVSVSALNPDSLTPLLAKMQALLPSGPYYYPPDLVTDQPERFIMGELIREQILLNTREEIPHSVAVTVDQVEESPTLTRVLATITVERESQKAILIGKKGDMLKTIGHNARLQMQKLVAGKIYLELFVRVRPHWRRSPGLLKDLGYRIESE